MVNTKNKKRQKKQQVGKVGSSPPKKLPQDEKKRKKTDEETQQESKSKNDNEDDINNNEDDDQQPEEKWSKSKKKRMRKLRAKQQQRAAVAGTERGGQNRNDQGGHSQIPNNDEPNDEGETTQQPAAKRPKKSTALQDAFKARLSGSRFRILNEELYTTASDESYQRFSTNPELFEQYHEGFRHQVESWPVNPVDVCVRWIIGKQQGKSNKSKKPCVIADFGCGDAQLAKDLLSSSDQGQLSKSKLKFKIHSFDLVSQNELVTACDMANVSLEDKTCDICVFCLSLMGTNLADFIREAHRVLKDDGRVKIAEVRSRIEYCHSSSGKKNKIKEKSSDKNKMDGKSSSSGTLDEFVDVLDQLGFECVKRDLSNKMFLVLELRKNGKKPDKTLAFSAKPCIYKRR